MPIMPRCLNEKIREDGADLVLRSFLSMAHRGSKVHGWRVGGEVAI
jgi:hypothetical protein